MDRPSLVAVTTSYLPRALTGMLEGTNRTGQFGGHEHFCLKTVKTVEIWSCLTTRQARESAGKIIADLGVLSK
jgi:hypothetical protein